MDAHLILDWLGVAIFMALAIVIVAVGLAAMNQPKRKPPGDC